MSVSRFLGFVRIMLILFLVIILIMLLLFVMMFVVVVFILLMVTFWCLGSLWLCVVWVCRVHEGVL